MPSSNWVLAAAPPTAKLLLEAAARQTLLAIWLLRTGCPSIRLLTMFMTQWRSGTTASTQRAWAREPVVNSRLAASLQTDHRLSCIQAVACR